MLNVIVIDSRTESFRTIEIEQAVKDGILTTSQADRLEQDLVPKGAVCIFGFRGFGRVLRHGPNIWKDCTCRTL